MTEGLHKLFRALADLGVLLLAFQNLWLVRRLNRIEKRLNNKQ